MKTVAEIKWEANLLLWVDEEEDTRKIEKILIKQGGSGRLIEGFKMLPNEEIKISFGDSPVLPVLQYFNNKYEEKSMVFFTDGGEK